MRPIRVHLDTSDYAQMYRAPAGTAEAHIRDRLVELSDIGRIQVGLSYHVVFELLQDALPEFQNDRISRATLLKRLCGKNAFPYPSDLGSGASFNTEGIWIPQIDLVGLDIERVIVNLLKSMSRHAEMNRDDRRPLGNRKYFAQKISESPDVYARLAERHWPLHFAKNFVIKGDLRRYLTGKISRDEANKAIRNEITDPITFFDVWFNRYRWENPALKRRDNISDKLVEMANALKAILDEQKILKKEITDLLKVRPAGRSNDSTYLKSLLRDVKNFGAELSSPEALMDSRPWIKMVGKGGAQLAAQVVYGLYKEDREIKRSDAIDMIHAMYLPHTDLWRGDKAFCDVLIKNRVTNFERVVPKLTCLIERIDAFVP